MPGQIHSSVHPPAQPTYVLRGHTAQIHAVHFLRQNLRLLTGDADGWVILWDLVIKRPIAIWKAHGTTVLGVGSWGTEKVITHGRDGKLHIWQLRSEDEAALSKNLPIDDVEGAVEERKQPWLLHTLVINAINFCSFASLVGARNQDTDDGELLVATPGVQDGAINVTSFPTETRVATIPQPEGTATGMIMAIGLCHTHDRDGHAKLTVVGGYESGHAAVFKQNPAGHRECLYLRKEHSQPVLSLSILAPPPDAKYGTGGCFFTSSADAIVARHPLPSSPNQTVAEPQALQTKHSGQQSLTLRSDARVFATAGWDGRIRVYSAKTMTELAVLKWHKEGCYAVAFADVGVGEGGGEARGSGKGEGEVGEGEVGEGEVVRKDLTVAEKRIEKVKTTHWLAAGSKDGKVSLWEVY